jgi:hypothetical protein
MGTRDSIQKNLQNFYIDNDESNINGQVQQGYQWIAEHLFLTERKQKHIFPSAAGMVTIIFGLSQQNIAAYTRKILSEEENGCGGYQYKKNLLN